MGSKEEAPAPTLARPILLDLSLLRCHERIQPDLLDRIRNEIRVDGHLKRPILVADGDFVILDGHHRFEALRQLGARRIPAYVVDYHSETVQVGVWPDASVRHVTKEEVIRRGKTGNLFPPKTSRHTVRATVDDHPVPLGDLM
ncbi:MAG TPA: ParB N-terminal domain-containing protein [Thermoplasmata archaeon]|nr:ParB N-terminal domain-containing protein [Thermoplasmata archaeon]